MGAVTDPSVALYIAASVALTVWLGIWFYLWRIDVQARALRRALNERRSHQTVSTSPVRPERVPSGVVHKE